MKLFRSLFFISAVVLIGCNQKLQIPKVVEIDPELKPLVDSFLADAERVGRPITIDNLKVRFSSPGTMVWPILGECNDGCRGECGNPTITINSDDFHTWRLTTQKAVMYHEIGHCVLWRPHDDNYVIVNGRGILKSIMSTYIQPYYMYDQYWDYYTHELLYGF